METTHLTLKVSRASDWSDNQPCEEAILRKYTRKDTRSAACPTKVPAYCGQSEWWYNQGTNHRVENGCIVRDFEDETYFVTFKTLMDLTSFIAKYGSCVVYTDSITIYDDYIE